MNRLFLSIGVLAILAGGLRADDWPQWLGPNRDAVWAEKGIIEKLPESGPKVLWRVPVSWGYAGPAVADGKVYVPDFETDADIRKVSNPSNRQPVKGKERLHCLDAKTGKEIWKHEVERTYAISYPGGPRCTPTVSGGKVYALGAEGDLLCLDATSGSVIWSKDFKAEYKAKVPMWGFAGHPLVDGQRLICIVGGDHATTVAFDKDTGKELWKAGNARATGYSSPAIIEAAGKRQLLIWDADNLNSLDPETGKLYWSVPAQSTFDMSIMVPRKFGDFLYVAAIDRKSLMLKLNSDKPGVTEVWRGTTKTGLSPVMMTPFLENDCIFGADQAGELMAADVATGKRLWATSEPISGAKKYQNGTAFIVKNGDRFFIFSENGNIIIARLTPKGYEEISKANILKPTNVSFGRDVVWSHPAFANRCMFARNDKEIVCVDLAKP